MQTQKRYLHDRIVLLLLTASGFFAVLTAVLVLLKLDSSRAEGYIVQFRPSLGLSAYYKGDSLDIISFAVFALFVFVFHTVLSRKIYDARRHFAIVVLSLGLLLIILSLIISNALLMLR